jgi:hypothetical protein
MRIHPSLNSSVAFAVAVSDVTAGRHSGALGWKDDVPQDRLPSDAEKQAHQLHDVQGLSDRQAAKLVGVSRETMTRRRRRFNRKVSALRLITADGACPVCKLFEELRS